MKQNPNAPTEAFERLYTRVGTYMRRYGDDDIFDGKYSILADHRGWAQVLIHIQDLEMLHPEIIESLQGIVRDFPGWEIVAVVALDDTEEWPRMGLYIRPYEIIDGLQRQYFPLRFRDFRYKTARPGTEDD